MRKASAIAAATKEAEDARREIVGTVTMGDLIAAVVAIANGEAPKQIADLATKADEIAAVDTALAEKIDAIKAAETVEDVRAASQASLNVSR